MTRENIVERLRFRGRIELLTGGSNRSPPQEIPELLRPLAYGDHCPYCGGPLQRSQATMPWEPRDTRTTQRCFRCYWWRERIDRDGYFQPWLKVGSLSELAHVSLELRTLGQAWGVSEAKLGRYSHFCSLSSLQIPATIPNAKASGISGPIF